MPASAVLEVFFEQFWRHVPPNIHHLAHTKNTVFSRVFSCFGRLMGAKNVEKSMKNELRNQCGNLYRRKCEKCARSSIYLCFIGFKKLYLRRGPGPGVPVRGKEFLPETPGKVPRLDNQYSANNHPANN